MTLPHELIEAFAARLDDAALSVRPTPQLTLEQPTLSLDDGYAVQRALIHRRVARGERRVGLKMGLTSRAKMEQVGVDRPILGELTDAMQRESGATVSRAKSIHPRVEPEIAFILKSDLAGPVSPAAAMLAVAGVLPAIELIDSRYENFSFTLPDVVADNASSSYFFLGDELTPVDRFSLRNIGMILEVDGVAVQFGSSAAILDHPARSLAALANALAERGAFVPAGSIVLAGAATAAVAVEAGSWIRLRADGIGEVTACIGP